MTNRLTIRPCNKSRIFGNWATFHKQRALHNFDTQADSSFATRIHRAMYLGPAVHSENSSVTWNLTRVDENWPCNEF